MNDEAETVEGLEPSDVSGEDTDLGDAGKKGDSWVDPDTQPLPRSGRPARSA